LKVPFEWLKEFVVIDIDPYELAKRLTMRGLEVEAIEEYKPSFENVLVGEIMSIDRHPSAEHLNICNVSDGKNNYPVVCGADNIKMGDKVPLAMIDARLANGMIIEKKILKGIESYGMLCSEM